MNLGTLLASKGRFGDTMLAHISPEEAELLKKHGGSGTLNPSTGLPEFFSIRKALGNIVHTAVDSTGVHGLRSAASSLTNLDPTGQLPSGLVNAAQTIAPIALNFIPGVGTALAAAYTAARAYGQGGSLGSSLGRGALTYGLGSLAGGEGGGNAANLGNTVGGYFGDSTLGTDIGQGLQGIGSKITGGISDAATGASSALGLGDLFGSSSSGGTDSLSNIVSKGVNSSGDLQAPSAIGSAAITGSGLASPSLSAGIGGGTSSFGSVQNLGALLGGANSLYANDKAQKALLDAQKNSLNTLQPYLASGAAANSRLGDLLGTSGNSSASGYGSLTTPFTADSLQSDPGYQFQLQQGNQALDRQQSAKGNYFSGQALKDAEAYGTGLADTTYKDAFARDAATKAQQYGMFSGQSGAGQTAANSAAGIYDNAGNARANADIASAGITNQTLASLLSGSGAKQLRGYGINGQPIYA